MILHGPAVALGAPVQPGLAPEGHVVDGVAFDHRPHRHPLGEPVVHRRKRRNVLYATTQRGRHRNDHGPRANGSAGRLHEHRVLFLDDAPHGRVQDHAPFQLAGQTRPTLPPRPRRTCTPRRRLRSRTAPRSCRRRRCQITHRAARRRGARRHRETPPRDRSRNWRRCSAGAQASTSRASARPAPRPSPPSRARPRARLSRARRGPGMRPAPHRARSGPRRGSRRPPRTQSDVHPS